MTFIDSDRVEEISVSWLLLLYCLLWSWKKKYPELRYKYRNREFWCRGYYVDTAGKNAKKIEEYIRHQLEEDKAGEQLTMGNF